MLETVIIVICVVICLGAAIFAWWMENGSESDDIKDDVTVFSEKE